MCLSAISLFFHRVFAFLGPQVFKPEVAIVPESTTILDDEIPSFRRKLIPWVRSKQRLPLCLVRVFVNECLRKLPRSLALRNASRPVVTVALEWWCVDYMTLFYACASFEMDIAMNLNISPTVIDFHNSDCVQKFDAAKYAACRQKIVINDLVFHAFLEIVNRSSSVKEIADRNQIHPYLLKKLLAHSGLALLSNYQRYLRAIES